ncbi:hypothetical protein QTP88_021009 [Uroleucon formosanum]
MEFTTMFSQNGKQLTVLDNFKFKFKYESKISGYKTWECTNKSYKAKLVFNKEKTLIQEKSVLDHTHEADSTIERQAVSNSIKRKISESNINEMPSKIIRKELRSLGNDTQLLTNDISYIRRNLYNKKTKYHPPLPKNINEVHEALINMNITTNKNENFLIIIDKETNIIIFTCLTNLKYLCSMEKVFMDGTFQFCTKFFYQFFVLHGFQNGIYTSLVYALLPNKRTSTYEHVFKKLRDACLTEGFVLNPNMFVIDFEIGIHEAVRSIWPTSIIRGCNFHLGQAWFRKLQNLGLSKLYIEGDTDEGKFLNYIFGLPFLEPHEVEDSFVFDLIADMPSNNQIVQSCDYLTETYMQDIFPPSLWASKSEVITNNVCESFHSKFNAYFYHHHPSLYKFIDALQDIQVDTYIKIKITYCAAQRHPLTHLFLFFTVLLKTTKKCLLLTSQKVPTIFSFLSEKTPLKKINVLLLS